MSKKWTFQNLKDKGIFVNQEGVGKVLVPKVKKVITEEDVKKAIKKAQRKVRGSSQEGQNT